MKYIWEILVLIIIILLIISFFIHNNRKYIPDPLNIGNPNDFCMIYKNKRIFFLEDKKNKGLYIVTNNINNATHICNNQ